MEDIKMEIKINVKKTGVLTGSAGWVSKRLENVECEIKKQRIYATWTGEDGKKIERPIAGVIVDSDTDCFARTTNDGLWYAYPCDRNLGCGYNVFTLFNTQLTEAGWSIANEFIHKALDAFREEWENN